MIISGEAGKGKSYLMKLVENMLHKGQVRTVHRASACSKDEGMFFGIDAWYNFHADFVYQTLASALKCTTKLHHKP